MVKKTKHFFLFCLIAFSSLAFAQEAKATMWSSLVGTIGTIGVARIALRNSVPIGAIGFGLWKSTKGYIFNQQAKENGRQIGLLRRDIGDVKDGQNELRIQLDSLARNLQKGHQKLEDGQIKMQGSLGNLDGNVSKIVSQSRKNMEQQDKNTKKLDEIIKSLAEKERLEKSKFWLLS